jgi:hypothetical protein
MAMDWHLTDMDLIGEVKALAESERQATAVLIASLAELDARRLYLREGCSSLFTYCTHVLHLSEHAAYGRIQAARTARRFPRVLDLLAAGDINLTTIGLLAAHLTADNQQELLGSAAHKTKRVRIGTALRTLDADVGEGTRSRPSCRKSMITGGEHVSEHFRATRIRENSGGSRPAWSRCRGHARKCAWQVASPHCRGT